MSTLIIGGSGFIGRHLCKALLDDGHTVVVKTRNAKKAKQIFDSINCQPIIIDQFEGLAPFESCLTNIISLAGAGIVDKRWTPARKQQLIHSRTQPLEELTAWLKANNIAFEKLLVGSAIGYYGFTSYG